MYAAHLPSPHDIADKGSAQARPDLPRTIGLWGALGLMLGVTIGSGIFETPASVAAQTTATWQVMALWIAGGVLSLLGALTFAELATILPKSGGLFNFLADGLGRAGRPTAFVFGWMYMLIIKPSAAAGIATITAKNLRVLLGVPPDRWSIPWVTCAILLVLTLLSLPGLRLGARLSVVLTSAKVLALAMIVASAASLALGGLTQSDAPGGVIDLGIGAAGARSATGESAMGPLGWLAFMGAMVGAMSGVLWSYDGWNDVGSVAGEVERPQRTLPRALILGTLLITLIYLAVNAAYLSVVSAEEMRALANTPGAPSVASVLMTRALGPSGAMVVVGMIVLSTLGSSFASVTTGARVTFAQAREGLLFAPLASIHPKFKTPHVSLWVQLAFSCACMAFYGTFEKLAGAFTFGMWIFYGLAACAIIVLRRTQPNIERPFRCPGYPLVPLLFVGSALFMTVLLIYEKPQDSLISLGVMALGVPVYYVWERCR